jgi:hypothetical protein
VVVKRDSKTFTIDVVSVKRLDKTFTLDTIIINRLTKIFTIDTLLLKTISPVFTVDVVLKKLAIPKTFTIDSVIIKRLTTTFTIDIALSKTITSLYNTIDSIIVNRLTKIFTTDTVLLGAGATYDKTFTIDTVLVGERAITLPVNGYTVTGRNGWIKVGTTPYLDESEDGDYIHCATQNATIGDFDFEDTIASGSPTTVDLAIRCRRLDDYSKADVYIDVGAGFILAGTITGLTHDYSWKKIDVTSIANTFTKVNAFKMYLEYKES